MISLRCARSSACSPPNSPLPASSADRYGETHRNPNCLPHQRPQGRIAPHDRSEQTGHGACGHGRFRCLHDDAQGAPLFGLLESSWLQKCLTLLSLIFTLLQEGLSSLAVVSSNGEIFENISATDLKVSSIHLRCERLLASGPCLAYSFHLIREPLPISNACCCRCGTTSQSLVHL